MGCIVIGLLLITNNGATKEITLCKYRINLEMMSQHGQDENPASVKNVFCRNCLKSVQKINVYIGI
jgi:hypothetical protein